MLNVKSLRVLVIFLDEEWVHEHKQFLRSDIEKTLQYVTVLTKMNVLRN